MEEQTKREKYLTIAYFGGNAIFIIIQHVWFFNQPLETKLFQKPLKTV